MASLQIRDMPEEVYAALSERARRERRSLAQQAVAELSRIEELEMRRQRLDTIERLRKKAKARGLSDPVRLVREDRQR